MPFYRNHVYSRLVGALGNPKPIHEVRRRLLPLASGCVLEIGFGTGVNLDYYDPSVSRLYALEPNRAMIRFAERHPKRSAFAIEFLDVPGERIPLQEGVVDSVVSTFTLCTISGVAEAINGIRRVLKPGGKLIFLENTASSDPHVIRWQRWCAPASRLLFAGLDLNRDIPAIIKTAGFRFEHIETGYFAQVPKCWSCCCWGSAIARSSPPGTSL